MARGRLDLSAVQSGRTNYRFWNEGKWTYRFRIWSYDRYDVASSLIMPSLEMRYPVRCATADGPPGMLPESLTGLTVSQPGTLVTAFGRNPDGTGTILRLWELAGFAGELTITFPANSKFTTAQPVNLRSEKTGDPVRVTSNALTFKLNAYAPASWILGGTSP